MHAVNPKYVLRNYIAQTAIDAAEEKEGRLRSTAFKAVDREGKRHPVVTHVHEADVDADPEPSRDYIELKS